MKITITVEVSSPDEAKVIIDRMSRTTNAWTDLQEARDELAAKETVTRSTPEERTDDTKLLHFRGSDEKGVERKNVSPGVSLITKIGSTTKEDLLRRLDGAPATLEYLGVKYTEHLKLLWSRGEVKFDGKEYYL